MFMRVIATAILVLSSVTTVSSQARADIHSDIENCQVVSDAACLKSILHRLASSSQPSPDPTPVVLLPGVYISINGESEYNYGTQIQIYDVRYSGRAVSSFKLATREGVV